VQKATLAQRVIRALAYKAIQVLVAKVTLVDKAIQE